MLAIHTLLYTVFSLLCIAAAYSCLMFFFGFVEISIQWVGWSVIGCLCLGITITFYVSESFNGTLIRADQRMGNRDLLSTAYEYMRLGKSGRIVNSMIDQARERVSQYGIKEILPFAVGRWVYLALPVFLIALVCHTAAQQKHRANVDTPDALHPKMVEISDQINTYKQTRESESGSSGESHLIRRINQTQKVITDPGVQTREALRSVQGLLDTVSRENQSDIQDLADFLNPGQSDQNTGQNQNGQTASGSDQIPVVNVDDLEQDLKDLFDDKIPEALSQGLSDLEDRLELENYLDQMLQDMMDETGQDLTEDSTGGGDQESMTDQSDAGSSMNDPSVEEGRDAGGDALADQARTDQKGSDNYIAGTEKSKGDEKAVRPIRSSSSRVVREKEGTYDDAHFRFSIRALTALGEVTGNEQDILKNYVRMNESVMLKEDIPESYRELIKQYFLAIGMTRPDQERKKDE